MIKEMRLIPTTKDSYPFITAVNACHLADHGYTEDEYFMTGTANIYEEPEPNKLVVSTPDAPYTTRLLIRRPTDVSKFSGNVVIEVLNASANMDIDRDWILMWKHIVRHGDIYIGITSKGHVVDALKKFDPVRYADINWANPTPDREGAPEPGFEFLKEYELGLYWDMQTDLAKLLRKDDPMNPIREYGKNWLYLLGWSQSGSYIARTINTFARLPENQGDQPLFDGYLNSGSGASNKIINSYAAGGRMRFNGLPTPNLLVSPQPVMAVNTESENRNCMWYGDFDEPGCRFRTWQIPCSSHDTKYTLVDYYAPLQDDLAKAGFTLEWEGYLGEPLNTPYEPIFCAALEALFRWVRECIPAPHAPKIETFFTAAPTDKTGALLANKKDAFGNAVGGIRHPAADCPTAVYQSYSDREDGNIQMMFGQCMPLTPETLKALYGSLEHYRELAAVSTDRAVAQGWILPEDRDAMIDAVTDIAAARGLK